ncbi:protein phosphatase 2C [Zalerion maritima]|uniref:Protein phosphatase 2C n=1 Tax=Zalerion maritima TaxID=339359 RepID=A0AAD5RNF6_9PEZI|nr:protein phosphatase 2C [Zalerion maritima]
MFGGGSGSSKADSPESNSIKERKSPSPDSNSTSASSSNPTPIKTSNQAASGEKRSGNGSPPGRPNPDTGNASDKKRRSSGVGSKASSLINAAKNTIISSRSGADSSSQTQMQKLGKQDPALVVPQGSYNNSAGESVPGPRSTFRVGVWEDKNKKCRRTMEDTHAFLYNFLATPAPAPEPKGATKPTGNGSTPSSGEDSASPDAVETDNGYFAIFDGHAGTFAADWCGKKLHIILEDVIRKNPNQPIPQLLDESFCSADAQLEQLPLKNSGCTAAIAVLRWEDRVPSNQSVTGSQAIAPAIASAAAGDLGKADEKTEDNASTKSESTTSRLKSAAIRHRVLYTANVGDARIILCRSGKALRLSYDHKGSDENEGKRITKAGGLILNNRVNGVLAVTRALGDTYMKDLVTGHPYTTETVIQPDLDEFIIIACDGLWDVCTDQEAVDLVRNMQDPVAASKLLVDHALSRFSTDNLSCMIVRFDRGALKDAHKKEPIGVEGDATGKGSEADKIVNSAKQGIAEGTVPVGSSGSNGGVNSEVPEKEDANSFTPTIIEGAVQEEPVVMDTEETPTQGQKQDQAISEEKESEKTPVASYD